MIGVRLTRPSMSVVLLLRNKKGRKAHRTLSTAIVLAEAEDEQCDEINDEKRDSVSDAADSREVDNGASEAENASDEEDAEGATGTEDVISAVQDGEREDAGEPAEIALSPEEFAKLMAELNKLLLENNDDEEPTLVADTVIQRAFPNASCD